MPQFFWSAGERLPERLDRLQRGTDLIVYSRPAAANRRAKRDHLAHDRGISRRDCASKDAAEAVPDDCDALAGFARDFFRAPSDQFHLASRTSDVEIDSRQVRLVPDAPEPSRERAKRPVARGESRNQQHGTAVAARHSNAVADRVARERCELLEEVEIGGGGELQQHTDCAFARHCHEMNSL